MVFRSCWSPLLVALAVLPLGGCGGEAPRPAAGAEPVAAATEPATWTWSVALTPGKDRSPQAWMWIPPGCQQVRGILYGRQVILEKLVLDDPVIRAVAAEQDLAVVITRNTDSTFTYRKDATGPQDIQTLLDRLAEVSSYAEVATAPWLPIGHSGAAIGAWNMGYAQPQRTFGIVGLHAVAITPPDYDGKASVRGIPILAINGEWEMWTGPDRHLSDHVTWLRGVLLGMRGLHQDLLATALVQPGAGHFNWDARLAEHVATFIRACATQRLPPRGSPTGTALRDLRPEDGWLSQATRAERSTIPPAPTAEYRGDPTLAYWHPTGDLAQRTDAYAALNADRKPQMLSFRVDGQVVPAGWIVGVKPPVAAEEEVRLEAVFLDRWPEKTKGAGTPLDHAAGGAVRYQLIGGWHGGGEQTGPDTFRPAPSHFGGSGGGLMVVASHPGDATHGFTEMVANVEFPDRLKAGAPQTIDFALPSTLPAEARELQLTATSSAGLPVRFTVLSGPAYLDGHRLVLVPLPPRAKRPATITVQAWQRGRAVDPQVQTATPVIRSLAWGG